VPFRDFLFFPSSCDETEMKGAVLR